MKMFAIEVGTKVLTANRQAGVAALRGAYTLTS
jgi:hypothetical protein